jgi:hypothetical protein
MAYIVKSTDGHACGHHHRTVVGAVKCAASLAKRAKAIAKRWKAPRVFDESKMRRIRRRSPGIVALA